MNYCLTHPEEYSCAVDCFLELNFAIFKDGLRHIIRIRQSLVRNDKIFFSLQRTSSCFPTFLPMFKICFPKFRELSNVSPNRSTVSSSGSSTPSANNYSLTLGSRERTKALHFSGFKIILLLRKHSHTTTSSLLTTCSTTVFLQLFQNQQNIADYHQHS